GLLESVTVPAVDLVIAPGPARLAPILPLCTLKDDAVSVPVPVLPLMEPLVRVTLPAASLLPPISSVPPLTVMFPPPRTWLSRVLSAPAVIVVPPVYELAVLETDRTPAPTLVNPPVPVMAPIRLAVLPAVSTVALPALSVTGAAMNKFPAVRRVAAEMFSA